MKNNKHFHAAKANKNDEFYTKLEDIENELVHYTKFFRDKTVYCNCDSPKHSNFWRYIRYQIFLMTIMALWEFRLLLLKNMTLLNSRLLV